MGSDKVNDKKKFSDSLRILYSDLFLELRKVDWPSRVVVFRLTRAVFSVMVIFIVVVGLLDFGLAKIIELLGGR